MSTNNTNDSEEKIQADCFQWLWNTYPRTRGLCFHIPNGGYRGIEQATRFKAMGVVRGIPDLCLALPGMLNMHYKNALYIEMKADKGKASHDQERVHTALRMAGNGVVICKSLEEFKEIVLTYLSGSPYIQREQ
jgi:hypothetical protein